MQMQNFNLFFRKMLLSFHAFLKLNYLLNAPRFNSTFCTLFSCTLCSFLYPRTKNVHHHFISNEKSVSKRIDKKHICLLFNFYILFFASKTRSLTLRIQSRKRGRETSYRKCNREKWEPKVENR